MASALDTSNGVLSANTDYHISHDPHTYTYTFNSHTYTQRKTHSASRLRSSVEARAVFVTVEAREPFRVTNKGQAPVSRNLQVLQAGRGIAPIQLLTTLRRQPTSELERGSTVDRCQMETSIAPRLRSAKSPYSAQSGFER